VSSCEFQEGDNRKPDYGNVKSSQVLFHYSDISPDYFQAGVRNAYGRSALLMQQAFCLPT
jgi:hypothetical protein